MVVAGSAATVVAGSAATVVAGSAARVVSGSAATVVASSAAMIVAGSSAMVVAGSSATVIAGSSATVVADSAAMVVAGSAATVVSGSGARVVSAGMSVVASSRSTSLGCLGSIILCLCSILALSCIVNSVRSSGALESMYLAYWMRRLISSSANADLALSMKKGLASRTLQDRGNATARHGRRLKITSLMLTIGVLFLQLPM